MKILNSDNGYGQIKTWKFLFKNLKNNYYSIRIFENYLWTWHVHQNIHTIDFHFKDRINQNRDLFISKNFDRKFQNLAVAVGQVCFRVANNVCAFLRTCSMVLTIDSFCMHLILMLVSTGVVIVFVILLNQ